MTDRALEMEILAAWRDEVRKKIAWVAETFDKPIESPFWPAIAQHIIKPYVYFREDYVKNPPAKAASGPTPQTSGPSKATPKSSTPLITSCVVSGPTRDHRDFLKSQENHRWEVGTDRWHIRLPNDDVAAFVAECQKRGMTVVVK